MNRTSSIAFYLTIAAILGCWSTAIVLPTVAFEESESSAGSPDVVEITAYQSQGEKNTARERARLLYQVYSSTLEVLHDHYFHANKAVLPARAMQDIFENVDSQTGIQTRWISVNSKAMSLDHEPRDLFEKEAAQKIAAGAKEVELSEGKTYRFAGSISLHEGCVHCHLGTFSNTSKKDRFAGLVISIPSDGTSRSAPKP